MMWLIFFAAAGGLLLLYPLTVRISIGKARLGVYLLPFGPLSLKAQIKLPLPPKRKRGQEQKAGRRKKRRLQVADIICLVRAFLPRLMWRRWRWRLVFGTGDAYSTALLCGQMHGALAIVGGWLFSVGSWREPPRLHVQPRFTEKQLELTADLIVSIRIGQIIQALLQYLRTKKGATC